MLTLLSGMLLLVLSMAAGGCAAPTLQRYAYAQIHMGTKARIVLYAPDEPAARAAAKIAFARLAYLDSVLSDYRQDSEINRLCAGQAGTWTHISPDLFHVLRSSRELAEASDGAFDPTVGPLSQLWRDARREGHLPEAEAIAQARQRVGFNLVDLDEASQAARLAREGMRLDFGAIGKGYGADEALDAMRNLGFSRALVDVGGDMAVGDPPPGARHWQIEIQTGYPEEARPVVRIANAGVATSGDSEQFIEIEGQRLSHILDPRSGLGLTTRSAATVVAPSGERADALASVVCILGPDAARALVEPMEGVGVRMMVDGVESRFGERARVIGR
jgi:FAD:protein FMN transferase